MGTIFSYRFHRLCHTLQLHFLHFNDVSAQEEHVCSACERAFTTSAHLAALAPHSRVRKVPQMSVPWLRNTVLVSGICMCPFSCHLCPCRIFSCLYSSYKTPAPATNSLLRRSSTPSLNSMVHQPSPPTSTTPSPTSSPSPTPSPSPSPSRSHLRPPRFRSFSPSTTIVSECTINPLIPSDSYIFIHLVLTSSSILSLFYTRSYVGLDN